MLELIAFVVVFLLIGAALVKLGTKVSPVFKAYVQALIAKVGALLDRSL